MIFSSTLFLLYFLPVFLIVYHLVPTFLKNWVLLFSSLFFYAWGAPKFIFVVVGSVIVDYYIINTMHQSAQTSKKKVLLFVSIAINLGLLLYFKYANFFVENLNTTLLG